MRNLIDASLSMIILMGFVVFSISHKLFSLVLILFYVSLDLGFGTGKSKSLYGREGHLGITLVKFAGDQSGLKDAVRLAEYFEKDSRGRKVWVRVQPSSLGKDDENNPSLVTVDQRTGEKKRILYGYLGTASDLDKVDFETRKKAVIESQREIKASK